MDIKRYMGPRIMNFMIVKNLATFSSKSSMVSSESVRVWINAMVWVT